MLAHQRRRGIALAWYPLGVTGMLALYLPVAHADEPAGLLRVTRIAELPMPTGRVHLCRFSNDGESIFFVRGPVEEIRLSSGEIRVLGQAKYAVPFQNGFGGWTANALFQNPENGAVYVSTSLCDSRHCRHQDVAIESFDGQVPPSLLWAEKVFADPVVAASPDGSWIAVGSERKVRLFSPDFAEPKHELSSGWAWFNSFSPDSRRLAVSGDSQGKVFIYELSSGKLIKELQLPSAEIRSACFSPDGANLLGIDERSRTVISLDFQTGAVSARLSNVRPTGLIPIPDSRVVAITTIDKGTLLRTADKLAGDVRIDGPAAKFSASDVVTASADGRRLAIWRTDEKLSVYSLDFDDARE